MGKQIEAFQTIFLEEIILFNAKKLEESVATSVWENRSLHSMWERSAMISSTTRVENTLFATRSLPITWFEPGKSTESSFKRVEDGSVRHHIEIPGETWIPIAQKLFKGNWMLATPYAMRLRELEDDMRAWSALEWVLTESAQTLSLHGTDASSLSKSKNQIAEKLIQNWGSEALLLIQHMYHTHETVISGKEAQTIRELVTILGQ